MMKYPMKNVEIITNIGWLLLIFFTRDKKAEARYKVPKTEMININTIYKLKHYIVLVLELMVKMPRIISPGLQNVVTAKMVTEDRK